MHPSTNHQFPAYSWGFNCYGQCGSTSVNLDEDQSELTLEQRVEESNRSLGWEAMPSLMRTIHFDTEDTEVRGNDDDRLPSINNKTVDCVRCEVLSSSFSPSNNAQQSKSTPHDLTLVQVTASQFHTLAITQSGKLYACGWNGRKQLGVKSNEHKYKYATDDVEEKPYIPTLTLVNLPTFSNNKVVSVACGAYHSLCALSSGDVYSWGEGGQLGYNEFDLMSTTTTFSSSFNNNPSSTTSSKRFINPTPKLINALSDVGVKVAKVVCGFDSSFCLSSSSDQLYSFGNQLGFGGGSNSSTTESYPKLVDFTNVNADESDKNEWSIIDVTAADNHVLVLHFNGNVTSFGLISNGRLGHPPAAPEIESISAPTLIDLFQNEGIYIKQIFAGGATSSAVSSSGELYMWGSNSSGNCFLGSDVDVTMPTLVSRFYDDKGEVRRVLDVGLGEDHSVVAVEGGGVYCCGKSGRLGVRVGDGDGGDELNESANDGDYRRKSKSKSDQFTITGSNEDEDEDKKQRCIPRRKSITFAQAIRQLVSDERTDDALYNSRSKHSNSVTSTSVFTGNLSLSLSQPNPNTDNENETETEFIVNAIAVGGSHSIAYIRAPPLTPARARSLYYCKNRKYGCKAETTKKRLKMHEEICSCEPIQCINVEHGCNAVRLLPNSNCKDSDSDAGGSEGLEYYYQHVLKCKYCPILCNHCFQNIPEVMYNEHLDACSEVRETCNLCEERVKRNDMKEHQSETCKRRTVTCSNRCGFSCQYDDGLEITNHEETLCKRRIVSCNACDSRVAFYFMEKHLLCCEGQGGEEEPEESTQEEAVIEPTAAVVEVVLMRKSSVVRRKSVAKRTGGGYKLTAVERGEK